MKIASGDDENRRSIMRCRMTSDQDLSATSSIRYLVAVLMCRFEQGTDRVDASSRGPSISQRGDQ